MEATKTQLRGLTATEAARRLEAQGPNRSVRREVSWLQVLWRTTNNPLTLLLVGIAIVSGFLGAPADAIIILCVVGLSVSLDFSNVLRSRRATAALEAQVRTSVTVIRDGKDQAIPQEQVVSGDLVQLEPGRLLPADAKVASSTSLFVDESSLTGESYPVAKPLGAIVYQGSSVTSGEGLVTITATGQDTRFSHLAASVGQVQETDFDRGLRSFSRLILRLVVVLAVFVFVANAVLKGNVLESLLFAVALAVGLTPELLPMIITLNLSRGAVRMSHHGVIVKQLSAIQNFGSMDVLCTDKTGTLTENRIVLVKAVDGAGQESAEVLRLGYLHAVFEGGVANPLDEAVKHHGKVDISGWHKLRELPFDFERRFSSVILSHGRERLLVTMGAVEEMLERCATEADGKHLTAARRQHFHATYQELSENGFRVLGIASQPKPVDKDPEGNLIFGGFLAFLDPAKPGVEATLKLIEDHQITIKILTGDNELVSRKIAQDIGLPIGGILTGPELDHMHETELATRVEQTTIFARLTPEQKQRVIRALRAGGHVVGYLGDGINDAPPLQAADVAISVNNAVDVAKETAGIVLMHKSLHQLTEGVIEGRRTFINTTKYLMMAISSNFGNMLSMAAASVLLPFLPMLPTQILLNNLIYDTSQLALPFDTVDADAVLRPRRWNFGFIKRAMVIFGPVSSVFDLATFAVLLWVLHLHEAGFQTGWFLESITTQILVVFIIRTARPDWWRSRPAAVLVASTLAAIAFSWAIIWSGLGRLFGFVHVNSLQALLIIVVVAVYLGTVSFVKLVAFRRWA